MLINRKIGRKWIVTGKGLLFLFFLFVYQTTSAQRHSPFTLLFSSPQKVILRFQAEPVQFRKVWTPKGPAYTPHTPQGIPLLKKGAPHLPVYSVSLRVPAESRLAVKLLSARFHEIQNILIAPSPGKLYRNRSTDSLPAHFGPAYQKNTFYPDSLWKVDKPYLLRNQEGQTLRIAPFRYNPVGKKLRIYDEITLEITFRPKDKQTSFTPLPQTSAEWEPVFRQHFLNPIPQVKQASTQETRPGMLIVSYGPFLPLLKDFIRWKQQNGFRVWVINGDSAGASEKIKACVQDIYKKHNISYLLLVGDAEQIPAGTIAGNTSDNYYAYVAGSDHYPDLFVGRFPAATAGQLQVMLRRTLAYEKATATDTVWYKKAIGIGSEQGPGYHHLMDFQHICYIDSAFLQPCCYPHISELFDGSQGGLDAPGNPDAALLAKTIEQGAGLINYCGHGSAQGWNTTHFDNTQVDKLKNTGRWPVILSVSCATGNFVHRTCFAEKWLRASYKGQPTGAVAALMPAAVQSWDAPMCGQQEMNHLLTDPSSLQHPTTLGKIVLQGCLKMNEEFGTDGYETTDTWILFGDPSLRVWTSAPKEIRAIFQTKVPDTLRVLVVGTNLTTGWGTLSDSLRIYSSAKVNNNGEILLPLDSVPHGKPLQLAITAYNHRPFFGNVILENTAGIKQSGTVAGWKVFPNPVKNGEKVTLAFTLLQKENVTLAISDNRGRKIRTIFSGILPAGKHRFLWSPSFPGIYFLQLKASQRNFVEKMIVR